MKEPEQENNCLLCVGIIGTVLTVLCCFTPLLVVLFGALGLAALVAIWTTCSSRS